MAVWSAPMACIVALGLHFAGFVWVGGLMNKTQTAGAQATGDGGTSPLTLAAAGNDVAALVAKWDAPVTIAAVPPRAPAMPVATPLIAPQPDLAAPVRAIVPAPRVLPPAGADSAPVIADAPAALPAARPKARPRVAPAPDTNANNASPATSPPAPPVTETRRAPAAPLEGPASAGQSDLVTPQVAAGGGGGTQAGSVGQASAGTLSGAAASDLRAEWGAGIRARIERRKRYPAGTTAVGTVKLRLTVGVDGRLQALSVLASSGDATLDSAAVKAVKAAGRFAKAPKGIQAPESFTLNISFAQ